MSEQDPAIDYHLGEPMDIFLEGNKIRKTGAPLNSQTIHYAFYNAVGNAPGELLTAISPGDVPFEASSDGNYFATIPATAEIIATLRPNTKYFLRLYGGASESSVNNRFILILAKYRSRA